VKVAPERLAQLKLLGDKLNLSMSDVVALLISQEIQRGTIPDTIPGVTITRTKRREVAFEFDDGAELLMPNALARSFSDTIERAAVGAIGGVLSIDDDYSVRRVGNGVQIEAPFGSVRTFTRDVARDIARLIREAAR
jgi:hypothetical protein